MATKKTKTASTGTMPSTGKAATGNIYAILAYIIWVLAPLYVVFTQKNDKFAVFHAKQALVLNVLWVVLWILLVIVGIIGTIIALIPVIGTIIGVLVGIFGLIAALVLTIVAPLISLWGAYKAYTGEWYRFPMIADWADKLNI